VSKDKLWKRLYHKLDPDLPEYEWRLLEDGIKFRSPNRLLYIYIRDRGICHLCGRWVDYVHASLDHIITRGYIIKNYSGLEQSRLLVTHTNFKLAHLACNQLRSNMTMEEWEVSIQRANLLSTRW